VTATRALAAFLVAAAAAAAIVVNLVLLGSASAQNAPVGKLQPVKSLPAAPDWTIRPTTTTGEHDHENDGNDD
jgi:hypothetical protein